MNRLLPILGFAVIMCGAASPAIARNTAIETALRTYGDTSMFYQALLTTGVLETLDDNSHYTVFAPVNTAFSDIPRQTYPCFYAEPCRPQIAALLQRHIMTGGYDLQELSSYGHVQTMAMRNIRVERAYVGKYTVDNQSIMSKSEIDGNFIYRINGVIATEQELEPFQNIVMDTAPDTFSERTVVRRTHHRPMAITRPSEDDDHDTTTETTTTTRHYGN